MRNPLDERSQLTAEFGPFIIALLVLAGLGLVIAAINVLDLFTAPRAAKTAHHGHEHRPGRDAAAFVLADRG